MVDEKEIEEKIRQFLLDDLYATIEETKHLTIDDIESYSGFEEWLEEATLKDFIDEYGLDWIICNVHVLEDEEIEYLEKKYGENN